MLTGSLIGRNDTRKDNRGTNGAKETEKKALEIPGMYLPVNGTAMDTHLGP